MTPRKWIGFVIGFIGIIPVIMHQTGAEAQMRSFWIFSWPELALFTATATSVLGWILLKKTVSVKQMSPLLADGFSMLLGGVLTLAHSRVFENWNPVPVFEWGGFIKTGLAMLVNSNLIAYNLYGFLLKKFTARSEKDTS